MDVQCAHALRSQLKAKGFAVAAIVILALGISGVAAFATDRLTLTGVERPEPLAAARVSAGFFDVLGITPSAGRAFRSDDDRPDSRLIVIGRRFWLREFNGEPHAIGSTHVARWLGAESLLLAAVGGAAGVLAASWAVDLARVFRPAIRAPTPR